ncbi:nuclear transport factor 2 family protein [Aquimarina litoralis]|uniref:nuclear transport factor 2 family protein n=1 Tax=Aquimarina litoralis TaxID=584605 RepID=UPI001C564383|nr:nuclear transport factor 2 family protein [Aquimarina litoralis]MBW1297871.1 hypothetical protein [Aquimarina litoralis]
MKTPIFICIAFFSLQCIFSQTDKELVEKTIQNYIDGSSYNRLDTLKDAFADNATLYLTARDTFKIFTPSEYVGFFKNRKVGEFNGRIGKILSCEVYKDIATAKAEISNPEQKWVYIDLFLLKKLNGAWKIISKTATRLQ